MAIFIPGSCWSMPNSGAPVTTCRLSTPVYDLPSRRYSERSLSFTVSAFGTGSAAALRTKVPYPSDLLPLQTALSRVVSVSAGTFQLAAAAETSMLRATAPARRSWSQLSGIEREPPALCRPYTFGFTGACSTCTSDHFASSSSAMINGNAVLMPWPISGPLL
jgi:hypothetical protein